MNNESAEHRGFSIGAIFGGVAAVLALIFILQNTESSTINFLFWEFDLAIWVWALILFLLGAVSGYGFSWRRQRRRRKN
jgi:uncharacterized integral membrane protein